MSYKRINIIGPPGSGKTEFARKIAEHYGLPTVHMDFIAHTKKTNPMFDKPAFDKKIEQECIKDNWIMEGVYKSTLEYRMPRADITFYLDLPRRVFAYRVLKRRFQYRRTKRAEMPEGWVEKIDFTFMKYVWNFNKNEKKYIVNELKKYDDKVKVIKTPAQVEDYIREL